MKLQTVLLSKGVEKMSAMELFSDVLISYGYQSTRHTVISSQASFVQSYEWTMLNYAGEAGNGYTASVAAAAIFQDTPMMIPQKTGATGPKFSRHADLLPQILSSNFRFFSYFAANNTVNKWRKK